MPGSETGLALASIPVVAPVTVAVPESQVPTVSKVPVTVAVVPRSGGTMTVTRVSVALQIERRFVVVLKNSVPSVQFDGAEETIVTCPPTV